MRELINKQGILEVDGDIYQCTIVGAQFRAKRENILYIDEEAYCKLLTGCEKPNIVILLVKLNCKSAVCEIMQSGSICIRESRRRDQKCRV
ncbi:MAG: hypothetical protein DRJ18_03005 [Candidatus Methanomethylicota archaeon]|mgnify:CR=1 FL=1|nr:hypothetical protein [Candidatus Culexmicrobium cathedralense]RLE47638.1 MAG: hypothetical protein DRJ18_03005 [Candidatus Verstraetearchaeota archaeon]